MFFTRSAPSLWFAAMLFAAMVFGPLSGDDGVSTAADRQARAKSAYAEGMDAVRRGDLASAYASFHRVVELLPRRPEAPYSFGWVLLNQGQLDSAINEFRASLSLRPNFVEAHVNLAN